MKVVHTSNKKTQKITQILYYGDFGCTTGFGNVSKNLIDIWKKNKNYNITVLAINDFSPSSYHYDKNVFVIPCLSIAEGRKDGYARLEFLQMLFNEPFDVLFCLNDVEVLNSICPDLFNVKREKTKQNKINFKSILYTPIDSAPRIEDLKVLDFFDEVITYTNYGKETLRPLVSEAKHKKIRVVPHGTESDKFYPLDKETISETKKQLFGSDDIFVFGSVNRNSARKDLATLILGYANFKHKHSEVNSVLYLHCNPVDSMGINIPRLCNRVGLTIDKDIFFPKSFSENSGISTEELNKIYNTFNVFITTTTSEGWGLSIVEAMATKTLVICPKHTSITEITNDGQNSLNFMFQQAAVFVNDYEKIRYLSNPVEVAQLCEVAYNIQNEEEEVQKEIDKKIDDAYNFVLKWKWSTIAKTFESIINKLA